MAMLLSLLLLALSVKEDRTPLRTGCSADADVIAMLPAGATITIRFALSGESPSCYKIAVPSEDKMLEGYLSAAAIDGLDDFDKGRRDAAWLDLEQIMAAIRSSERAMGAAQGVAGQAVAREAEQLIATSQPAKALEILEPEIRKRKDPTLLALAGVASWRADDSRRALEYWRGSLDLEPNSDIEHLYRAVERETRGDLSTGRVFGLRVVLRYEAAAIPAETARQMAAALDQEFIRISGQLGCNAEERIVAIVQTRDAYRKTTQAAEWSGGQYDGRIRVPVSEGQGVDPAMRRILAHETTHACLSMLGRWPAWLQEGLAQRLSGDALTPALRQKLAGMARQGKLPRLNDLSQNWSRMDTEHAVVAYALSLAAVELFYQNYSQYGIGNLVHNPERLAEITADLDRRLGLSL